VTLLLASRRERSEIMTGVPKRSQPEPWQSGQGDDARLKQALDCCEKENRWLNDLVIRIGETLMRRIKGWKTRALLVSAVLRFAAFCAEPR
jgi:hypothetical protein